jgi:hypothetical protein
MRVSPAYRLTNHSAVCSHPLNIFYMPHHIKLYWAVVVFFVMAPQTWNNLSLSVRAIYNFDTFLLKISRN